MVDDQKAGAKEAASTRQRKSGKRAHPLIGHRSTKNKSSARHRSFWEGFGFFFALCVILGGLAFFVSAGLDSFRPQLAAALSRAAGREIRLEGAVGLGLSLGKGINLSVQNVVIANPEWAQRAAFARIGQLNIGVALRPLLDRRVEILSFALRDADIQFEKGPQNEPNWAFRKDKKNTQNPPSSAAIDTEISGDTLPTEDQSNTIGADTKKFRFILKAKSATVENSRLSFLERDGSVTPVRAEKLDVMPTDQGVEIHFIGVVKDASVKMDVKGGLLENILADVWPFQADIQYGALVAHAEGVLEDAARVITVSRSRIVAQDTNLAATLTVDLKGPRPVMRGSIQGGYLSFSDLAQNDLRQEVWHDIVSLHQKDQKKAEQKEKKSSVEKRFFSAKEINLSGLVGFDADIDFAINAFAFGLAKMDSLRGKLLLENGKMLISPLSGYLGDSKVEGQIQLDASQKPAAFSAIVKAHDLDLSQMALIAGTEGFLQGKVDFDLDLSSRGNSMRDLAASSNGSVQLIGAGGTVSGKALDNIAATVLSALMPGQTSRDQTSMNCIVMNLTIKDGLLRADGVAMDTTYASITADGVADLREEILKFKVDTAVKSIVFSAPLPPLSIEGSFVDPHYKTDAIAGAKNIFSALSAKISEIKDGKIAKPSSAPNRAACSNLLLRKKAGAPLIDMPKPDPSPRAKSSLEKFGDTIMNGLGQNILGIRK